MYQSSNNRYVRIGNRDPTVETRSNEQTKNASKDGNDVQQRAIRDGCNELRGVYRNDVMMSR